MNAQSPILDNPTKFPPTPQAHPASPYTLKVLIAGIGRGNYQAWEGSRLLIERTGEPLFAAARALLAEGHDPDATLVMARMDTPSRVDMTARLGTASKMTVIEGSSTGPRLAKWTPCNHPSIHRKEAAQ
jgi:hypothetical protein